MHRVNRRVRDRTRSAARVRSAGQLAVVENTIADIEAGEPLVIHALLRRTPRHTSSCRPPTCRAGYRHAVQRLRQPVGKRREARRVAPVARAALDLLGEVADLPSADRAGRALDAMGLAAGVVEPALAERLVQRAQVLARRRARRRP